MSMALLIFTHLACVAAACALCYCVGRDRGRIVGNKEGWKACENNFWQTVDAEINRQKEERRND